MLNMENFKNINVPIQEPSDCSIDELDKAFSNALDCLSALLLYCLAEIVKEVILSAVECNFEKEVLPIDCSDN